jgi:hypothetical protein
MIKVLALLLVVSVNVVAFADDNSDQVLNNAAVVNLASLVNQTHGSTCAVPLKPENIRWMCTGAIPPVTEPTLQPTGCGFFVDIKCPTETVRIGGRLASYLLVMPPATVQSTSSSEVVIGSVTTIQE